MNRAAEQISDGGEPVRVLGRGLRAARGVRLTLRALRDAVGRTQAALAGAASMDQADVSRLETRPELDACQVDTLRRYVAALGGDLEVVAIFGDKRFILVGAARPETVQQADEPDEAPRRR